MSAQDFRIVTLTKPLVIEATRSCTHVHKKDKHMSHVHHVTFIGHLAGIIYYSMFSYPGIL